MAATVLEEVKVCWLWCGTQTALLAPGAACSLPFLQDVLNLSGAFRDLHKEQLRQRGSGMGNDSRKDNDSYKKIKGLEIPESEMTACCCHCCCPHCLWVPWLGAVEHCFGYLLWHSPTTEHWEPTILSEWIFSLVMGSFP